MLSVPLRASSERSFQILFVGLYLRPSVVPCFSRETQTCRFDRQITRKIFTEIRLRRETVLKLRVSNLATMEDGKSKIAALESNVTEIAVEETAANKPTVTELGPSKVTTSKDTVHETAVLKCSLLEANISERAVLVLWRLYNLVVVPLSSECSILS